MQTQHIASIDDARLDVYRSLKKTNRTRHAQLFVVEGATVVKRLLRSQYHVDSVLVVESRLAEFAAAASNGTTLLSISKQLASELVGFKFHMGVLAAAARKPVPALADVLPQEKPSLVLYGDQIIDQQNVGMLIRIGAAFGADAIVLSPGSADPFSRRVIKVSMGNGLFTPVISDNANDDSLNQLKDLQYTITATVLDDTAEELTASSFAPRTAIVFGNESSGISDHVLAACHRRLTISMLNGTDSVNVSIAAGIFSHSYRTQFPAVRAESR